MMIFEWNYFFLCVIAIIIEAKLKKAIFPRLLLNFGCLAKLDYVLLIVVLFSRALHVIAERLSVFFLSTLMGSSRIDETPI